MTRTLIVIAAFLTLSLPAALAAPPEDKPGKSAAAPGQSAEKAAKKALKKRCNALRKTDPSAFQAQCAKTKKEKEKAEDTESQEARENASKECKEERESIGLEAFRAKYAPPGHPTGANAFGKCVSKLAKDKTTD